MRNEFSFHLILINHKKLPLSSILNTIDLKMIEKTEIYDVIIGMYIFQIQKENPTIDKGVR